MSKVRRYSLYQENVPFRLSSFYSAFHEMERTFFFFYINSTIAFKTVFTFLGFLDLFCENDKYKVLVFLIAFLFLANDLLMLAKISRNTIAQV